jgi:hypothetical protein
MRDTIIIELFNGETIRMTTADAAARGELIRDGVVVASACFANAGALRRWADALIERAARSSPRAICLNCED